MTAAKKKTTRKKRNDGDDAEENPPKKKPKKKTAKPAAAELARARRSYRVTHWGAPHETEGAKRQRCADPRDGVQTILGEITQITYRTSKTGDPKRTQYFHDFGSPLPILTYSKSGLLMIVGGGYRVGVRGIVG